IISGDPVNSTELARGAMRFAYCALRALTDRRHIVPSPACGGGTGRGHAKKIHARMLTPSPPLQPKSDVSDFGQLIKWPNSGKPEFGCKRGREQTELVARAAASSHECALKGLHLKTR